MDSLQVVVVASPFSNLPSLYEIDPDADVLLLVPPHHQFLALWHEPRVDGFNGVNGVKQTSAAAAAARTGLRIKVSSKHLALASRVFKNKLQFGSSQATRQSDGRVHLQLAEGFDPTAVSIVMNVIHGRGSKVPKSVNLETLVQIALFVDRFQLLDSVDVYAERWISKLEGRLPTTYNRDLVLWLYISHVFRHADIFKAVTKTAAAQTAGPINTLGLPIREKIIQNIDTTRQSLLTHTLATLHTTLDDLAADTAACSTHNCDSLLIGELIKSLHRQRLAWPRPAAPFAGVSFASVVSAVETGLRVHEKGQRRRDSGVGLWSAVNGVNGVNGTNGVKDKDPWGARPAWGVVGGNFPITPAASPELRSNGGGFGEHECDATRVVARLEGLERLGHGVEGLELESKLGYRLY